MKTIYLKTKTPVNIGDTIGIDGVKIMIDQKFIDNNPHLFEIEDDTPEYVECTKGKGGQWYSKPGRIYKVKSLLDEVLTVTEGGLTDSIYRISFHKAYFDNTTNFKPSTKKEYLLQEVHERYSVGDKVDQTNAYNGLGGIHIIGKGDAGFDYMDGCYFNLSIGGVGVYNEEYGVWAEIVKPIFATEDKVNIYNGDLVYWVTSSCNINYTNWNANFNSVCDSNTYFSSKQAAQDYVNANREMRLEDYEQMLLNDDRYTNSVTGAVPRAKFYYTLRGEDPKLYWIKILELIAKDLNDGWKPDYNDLKAKVSIDFRVTGKGYVSNHWQSANSGKVMFKSREICDKAIKIMGDRLDHIYKQ